MTLKPPRGEHGLQQAQGSTLVLGVRFHTTKVAVSTTPSVEVMAYGTAVLSTTPTPRQA